MFVTSVPNIELNTPYTHTHTCTHTHTYTHIYLFALACARYISLSWIPDDVVATEDTLLADSYRSVNSFCLNKSAHLTESKSNLSLVSKYTVVER